MSHLASPSRIPVDASPDLWPCVWTWIDFFHTYWDYLPISEVFKQIPKTIIHSPIIIAMDKNARTSEVIRSAPGVRLVLALAWRGMLGEDDRQVLDRPGALLAISEAAAIVTDDTNVGGNFDELVEAAGGRVTDLASTVVQHFSRAHSARKSQTTALFLMSCINLLDEHTDPTRSLCNALRSIGFVAILVHIISTVHDTDAESVISDCAQSVLIACLGCLVKMLKAPPDIALAIDSGLLQLAVVIAASIKGVTDGKHMIIQRMFDKVLIPSLVHYAVVAQLQKCFPEAAAVAARSTIEKSPFAAAWKNLSTLIKSRVGFLNSWEAKARPSFKACDNLICGKIASRHDFKCCAACRTMDYCSEECQSADWRAGHKDMCQSLAHVKFRRPETITTRGKSFMRALLTHDYQSLILDMCSRKVHFMSLHIRVGRSSDLELFDPASEILLQFPRESRSGGRMDLHVMATLEGDTSRLHLFPMRTSTAKLHHRLVAVAQEIREIPRNTPRAEFLHHVGRLVISSVEEAKCDPDFELIH
ncbi:hypothetical protein B0H19DRAFT_1265746 [Mycena capillaripes]|nr:hypothetical protein B0H19DRAFT_1265746 [Mycena capillaripes]